MVRRFLTRTASRRGGSILLALALSLPALPIVAWAIGHPSLPSSWGGTNRNELGDSVLMAIVALILASVAGGLVGGRLRGRPTMAVFLTTTIAWFVGVASLSITSSLLGMRYLGAVFCIDGCQPFLSSSNPLSGAMAWGEGVVLSTISLVPPLIALALLAYSRRLLRRGRTTAAASLAVAGAAFFQSWTFLGGGTAAIAVFLCLGVGVVIWSTYIVMAPPHPEVPIQAQPVPSAA